jgi:hypothetical protein
MTSEASIEGHLSKDSCGGGEQERVRSREVMPENGGDECEGPHQETQSCNDEDCPGGALAASMKGLLPMKNISKRKLPLFYLLVICGLAIGDVLCIKRHRHPCAGFVLKWRPNRGASKLVLRAPGHTWLSPCTRFFLIYSITE